MANVTESPLKESTAAALPESNRQGLRALGLDETASPQTIINALDQFVDDLQQGIRKPDKILDAEDAPYALGSLWGEQLVRQFNWQWGVITFHDHNNSKVPAVLSPDRALAIYPFHFLMGCLKDRGVDVTIALAFNMLVARKVGKLKPKEYYNLMEGVKRIVPRH